MPPVSSNALKISLIREGFEVYRTQGSRIVLAERVRDNLIMDSGVAAVASEPLAARFNVRAQESDFPGDSEEQLYGHAREQGRLALARGYVEVEQILVPVHDPGDRSRTLDTWYEVAFEKPVESERALFEELRYALQLDKTASPAGRR
jgi:hypothetical protein